MNWTFRNNICVRFLALPFCQTQSVATANAYCTSQNVKKTRRKKEPLSRYGFFFLFPFLALSQGLTYSNESIHMPERRGSTYQTKGCNCKYISSSRSYPASRGYSTLTISFSPLFSLPAIPRPFQRPKKGFLSAHHYYVVLYIETMHLTSKRTTGLFPVVAARKNYSSTVFYIYIYIYVCVCVQGSLWTLDCTEQVNKIRKMGSTLSTINRLFLFLFLFRLG